jgi:hypothetical protein
MSKNTLAPIQLSPLAPLAYQSQPVPITSRKPPDSASYKDVSQTPSLHAPRPLSSQQTTAPPCNFNSHRSSSKKNVIRQTGLHNNVTRQLSMWCSTLRDRHLRRTSGQGEMTTSPVITNTANSYDLRQHEQHLSCHSTSGVTCRC